MNSLKAAHLFRLIQSFLNEKDYLALMNCNLAMFNDIKRETIKFCKFAQNLDEEELTLLFGELEKMFQKVLVPSRQISLKISRITPSAVPLLRSITRNLYSLSIETHSPYAWTSFYSPKAEPIYQNIDLTMFNDIPILDLSGFPGLTKITNGLQNINHLTLNLPDLTEVYDWNSSKSLKSLKIVGRKFIHLPLESNYNDELKVIIDERDLWLQSYRFGFEFNDSYNLLYLSSVVLSGNFRKSHLNIVRLLKVDQLSLTHVDFLPDRPEFPFPFHGKSLTLENFSLIEWPMDLSLPNIKSLNLSGCKGPKELPNMPNLSSLILNNIFNTQRIKALPRCISADLCSVDSLTFFDHQPMLKELKISTFHTFIHSFDGHFFNSVEIYKPLSHMQMNWLRNTKNVCIHKLRQFHSIAGYERSDIPSEEKKITLHDFEKIDLTSLSNVKEVSLDSSQFFGSKKDLTKLSNIGDLLIRDCFNYRSTSNLYNIRDRLCIDRCPRLSKLVKLQGIPEVMLGSLPAVDDFSGLGDNDHVYVCKVPYLIECAKNYQKIRHDTSLKATLPYSAVFATIKAFTIILYKRLDCDESEDNKEHDSNSGKIADFSLDWDDVGSYECIHLW